MARRITGAEGKRAEAETPRLSLEAVNGHWVREIAKNISPATPLRVSFGDAVVHPLIAWSYAFRRARRGPWMRCACDRARFNRRILLVGRVISPVLQVEHRATYFNRINKGPGPPCD